MWKLSFLKYRGLFISTTAFVLFFILYLLVNYSFQNKTISNISYSDTIQKTYSKMSDEGLTPDLLRDLSTIKLGGIVKLSTNNQVMLDTIEKQLPNAVDVISNLLAAANAHNETLASQYMSELSLWLLLKKIAQLSY